MPIRTFKRSSKSKNKTRSRKQCGGAWKYFGFDEEKDEEKFRQFYRDLGLGHKGINAANHKNVVETLRNWQ